MSLDSLAPKIARHDEKAFAELYEKTRRLVFSVCLGVVKNSALAEELTQDVFVIVWSRAGEFRGKGFKTWLLTIARNSSINALKKARRETATDFFENEHLGGRYTVDEQIETGAVLKAALDKLGEPDRQIVLMKNAGLKMKEIAQVLGLPRGTASWRYSVAIDVLK